MDEAYFQIIPRCRPVVERQQRLYWSKKRRIAKTSGLDGESGQNPVRDNGEPWLGHSPRTVGEILWIMQEMKKRAQQWNLELKTS
ncbi:MAG: hypothetical protein WCS31_02710 [Verrucomicrobiae bacterium]